MGMSPCIDNSVAMDAVTLSEKTHTIALLHQLGTTESCTCTVGIQFIEPPDT